MCSFKVYCVVLNPSIYGCMLFAYQGYLIEVQLPLIKGNLGFNYGPCKVLKGVLNVVYVCI